MPRREGRRGPGRRVGSAVGTDRGGDHSSLRRGPHHFDRRLVHPHYQKVLEALPDCWAVGRYGIGVDNIDVEAATDCGIVVFNVADYCVEEVADHAAALVLACARRVVILDRQVRAGGWGNPPLEYPLRRVRPPDIGIGRFRQHRPPHGPPLAGVRHAHPGHRPLRGSPVGR